MVKLKEQTEVLRFDDLKDGQIGVIVKHPNIEHVGEIGQKHDGNFIILGEETCRRFTTLNALCSTALIKPLKNGTELIIENNE